MTKIKVFDFIILMWYKSFDMKVTRKIKLTYVYILRLLRELIMDIVAYYISPYPILLVIGFFRRVNRHLKILWLPKRPGRPAIDESIVVLILDMKRANWLWGALRISQELKLLGIRVHKKTVMKILRENGLVPPPVKFQPPSWQSLIEPFRTKWSMDFTCIMDILNYQIFILVILDYSTRQVVWINVTLHPTREWIMQQFKNIAFEGINYPEALIIDNDGIYGRWISPLMKDFFDIKVQRIPPGMPIFNGRVERFHKSLKNEILKRLIIFDMEQVQKICRLYRFYYNNHRPHQSLDGNTPFSLKKGVSNVKKISGYQKIYEVGGLITRFELEKHQRAA